MILPSNMDAFGREEHGGVIRGDIPGMPPAPPISPWLRKWREIDARMAAEATSADGAR